MNRRERRAQETKLIKGRKIKMRAILIDPEKKAVTEIQLVDGSYLEMQRVLQCRSWTTGAHLGGSYEEGFDAIYASDDPLDDCDDPRFWFQLDADRNPPSSFPIAGLGVAHGIDPGNGCDVRISVAELERRITFTERKFKGFSVKTFDSAEQSGLVRAIMQIEPVAPIIDGTDEGKAIKQTRPDSWDAKMLSGEPLITDDQFERLLANYAATAQPVLVVKIFLPHVRWLLCWIYPDDRDLAFAVTKVGNKAPTTGDVRLSNIVRCRLGMLMPERDKYIKLDRPLSHYVLRDVDW